jgi:DNA-binding response OmpR family regulator
MNNAEKPSNGRILILDADPDDLKLYTYLLRNQGYRVDSCETQPKAAEMIENGRYDLIILGQGGPVFKGQDLVERAIEQNRHRPVLVLTRSIDMRGYIDAMNLGAHDYIEKPPHPADIVKIASNCLSRPQMPAAAGT